MFRGICWLALYIVFISSLYADGHEGANDKVKDELRPIPTMGELFTAHASLPGPSDGLFEGLVIMNRAIGDLPPLGFYGMNAPLGMTNKVYNLMDEADRTIHYSGNKKYDIGLGPIRGNTRYPILLTLEELRPFLAKEKHRDFIVVYLEKFAMTDGYEYETIAAEQTKHMQDLGYERVVVLGASAMGIHYIADTQLDIIRQLKEE